MIKPHQARPIRFLELAVLEGWRLKLYGISQHSERPDDAYIEKAKEIARSSLPQPPIAADRYGVAFATIHQAEMFNQILVDWWERENELRHHVFKAESGAPLEFQDITASGEAFCVWELRVLAFERDAWMTHALSNPSGPDFEAYASVCLSEDA